MSNISNQLISNSFNYVLQADLVSGNVYRIGGAIPVDPKFLSGLTVFSTFKFSDGSEQNGYVLTSDALGNANWQPSPADVKVTAFTYTPNTFTIFDSSGNTFDATINSVTGLTINGDLTITGDTFLNNISATTISATTYLNLPTDSNTFVTAFTYNDNTFTILDNSGNTFDATINNVTGLTVNGSLSAITISADTIENVQYIDFDITNTGTTSAPGRLFWDVNNRTLSVGMIGGATQQIGEEQYYLVENQTSGTLNDGYVVRAAGTTGASGKILIDYMIANGTIPAFTTLGVLTQTLNSGDTGYVTSFGLVRNIDTTGAPYGETWNQGDILYVSDTILGGFTKFKPINPNLDIIIAIVMEQGVNGSIFVRPDVYRPFKDPNRIIVAKQNGDFTSIKDAVDSITSSSSSNRYVIDVGPGEFYEDTIDLTSTPYVSIVGSNIQTTLIIPTGSTQHILNIGINNEISFLSFSGAGSGWAAINCDDIGDFAQAHKCSFYDCDVNIWVKSSTQDTKFYGEYLDFNGEYSYGIKSEATNGFLAFANLENCYNFPVGTGVTIGNYATGSGATINTYVVDNISNGVSGSTAYWIEDDAMIHASAINTEGWTYGIYIPNIGGPPMFQFNGSTFTDNQYDAYVDRIGTMGYYQGIADHTKIYNVSDDFYWLFLDSDDGELDVTRKISVTFTDGSHTDASTLIFEGSTMGLMSGGTISTVSATTINTQAGYGYLETSANIGIVRRIDWTDTTITLSADTENYIYINENGILSASGSIPNTFFNILMGRVVTNSTGVEFIEQSPQNANHTSNRFSTFNRIALGPVYATGSIVTEGTIPFTLDVSAGDYFFSENQFLPSGGNPITFTQYYRDGLGGWITSATTGVTNSYYDGNGVLSGLTGYTKHTLYVVGDGVDEKYFLVLGQNEYSTLVQTEGALLPTPPTYFDDAVTQIANIYVQGGTTGITQIEDIRPVIGFKAGGVNASSLHANLLGLSSDDHLQYLLVNGGRAMAGNLDMGSNDITNVNLVDGVDVSSHATRHQFGGLDPVGTTTPTANAIPYADVSGTLDSWITPITISGGTGILTGGTYPNFSITNTLPDQVVTISGGTGILTGGTYPNFEITNALPDLTVTLTDGTGISTSGTYPNFTITNTLPDQTVTISGGTGITTGGTYPNFSITNNAPDQIVTISGGTGILTGGTYPNFEITNTAPDQIVTISGGTGILTGGTYPNFEITNTAPDQIVVLNNGTGISTSGTYPNFTITNTLPDQTVTISGGTGITTGGTYPNFSITNNAPDQIVTISEGSGMSVTGTYPNFTIANTGETYVTGVTYSANTLTVSQNGGQSAINTTIGLRIKSGTVAAGSFAGNPRTATVTFTTAYPNTSYSIGITGSDNRTFTYSNKTTTGFTISSNANTNLTGNVDWQTIAYGES